MIICYDFDNMIYCGDNERAKVCLKQVRLIDKGVFRDEGRDYDHIFVSGIVRILKIMIKIIFSGMVRSVSWSRHWMGCCCC